MKGVILAAGYATRFLPASKTIPKEMFPIIDTPVIDLILREMVDSGIKDILLISSRRKKSLEDYFDREVELATTFAQNNQIEKLNHIKPIDANIFVLRQQYMMGTGNALMLAEPFIKDEPFVVAYPDDVVLSKKPLCKQLIEVYKKTGKSVLAIQDLGDNDVSRYGVIDPTKTEGKIVHFKQMVEKPLKGSEPSKMVSYGRYLYTPDIFKALKKSFHNHNNTGEFTQTEAINYLATTGKFCAVKFSGKRYDVGEPLGYIKTTIQMALQRDEFRDDVLNFMKKTLAKNK